MMTGLFERRRYSFQNLFLMENVHQKDPMPGATIAIQTFGDFLGFNPPCHILCTDGCFYGNGMFRVAPLDGEVIKKIFKHLGLWPVESLEVERDRKAKSPTEATGPPKPLKYTFDYSTSQLPDSDNLS